VTKTKTIHLTYWHHTRDPKWQHGKPDQYVYQVEKVTNSVEFAPGQQLNKTEVEALCAAPLWNVSVTKKAELT
jgi:hypothetical protein